MARSAALLMLVPLLTSSSAVGKEWARKMFNVAEHDFGSVARGAKAEFKFIVTNIYGEDIHIAGVRSSCGCTKPRIEVDLLKPSAKGAIVAALNTRSFYGHKSANITVTIDRPYYAEVRLRVRAYIRRDVVFRPGSVQLGKVACHEAAHTKVVVDYAGRGDWKILKVASANPHLSADVVETDRQFGRVKYALDVRLDEETPVGYVRDYLILTTNDRRSARIPLLVEGNVTAAATAAVSVSPPALFMGVVEPGSAVTKRLVVRGQKPFRIVSIQCDDDHFAFDVPQGDVAKAVHLVPVTFVAGEESGKVAQTIRIETDLGEPKPELAAYAVVDAKP